MDTNKTTYLLALEVQPMTVGQAYEQLPMHCTIMPRFHTALSADDLLAELEPVLASFRPIELIAGEHLAFGPKKVLVTLTQPSENITKLHLALFDKLSKLNVQHAELDWVSEGFIPHVTDKQGKRFSALKPLESSRAYLISVEHPLKGNQLKVHHKFELK